MRWTSQSELCWIKLLDFESHNGKKLIKKLISDIRKGIFFLFLLIFTWRNLFLAPCLLIFISVVAPFPPAQPCFFGGRRGLGGRTRSVRICCAPQQSGTTVFFWKMLAQGCFVTLPWAEFPWNLSFPYLTLRRSEQIQFWPLQPPEITVYFSSILW